MFVVGYNVESTKQKTAPKPVKNTETVVVNRLLWRH